MAQILLQDNFTGTTIDTGKWTETDPNGFISQNGNLILTLPHSSNINEFTNKLVSVSNITSGVAVTQANLTWTTDSSQEAIGGLYLYKDNNNWASITSRGVGGYYRLRIMTGGTSRYSLEPTGSETAKGKDVKIWTDGTDIKFFSWSGSSWTQMGTTQTFSLGYNLYSAISCVDNTAFNAANPVVLDNLYFSDQDYTTQYPNFDLTLGEYLGAGSATTKLLLHLNGNSTDSSGNGNNGTDSNITYSQANGKFGQGAGFNGSSSFSSFSGANVNFEYNSPFTIVAWIKPKTFVSELIIFSTLTNSSTLKGWEFSKSGTGLNFYLINNWNGGSGPRLQVYCSDYISEEKWYNVIVTYDGSSNASGVNFYINGVKATTQGASNLGTNSTATTNTLYFGKRSSNNLYFNGAMDESFIESGNWSESKVKKYYTMTKGFYATL